MQLRCTLGSCATGACARQAACTNAIVSTLKSLPARRSYPGTPAMNLGTSSNSDHLLFHISPRYSLKPFTCSKPRPICVKHQMGFKFDTPSNINAHKARIPTAFTAFADQLARCVTLCPNTHPCEMQHPLSHNFFTCFVYKSSKCNGNFGGVPDDSLDSIGEPHALHGVSARVRLYFRFFL